MTSLKTKQWTINVSSLCKARLFSRQEARPNSRSFCRGLVAFLMVTLLVSGGFSQNPVANGVALDNVKIDRVQDRTTGIIEGNVFEDVNADVLCARPRGRRERGALGHRCARGARVDGANT